MLITTNYIYKWKKLLTTQSLWSLIMEPFWLSVSQYDMIEISICAELLLIKSIRLASLLHPALPFVTQMDIEVFSHLLVSSEHTFSINI